MVMLAYGYYDLIAGEESSTEWMPHITANVQRLAEHSHDGVDSATLTISSLIKGTQTLLNTDWVVDGVGFKQTVTMPGAFTYANSIMSFRLNKAGDPLDGSYVYPTVIPIAAAQYDIYVSDNTINLDVVYI